MKIDKDMNYYFQLEAIDGYFEYYRRPRLVGLFAIEKSSTPPLDSFEYL